MVRVKLDVEGKLFGIPYQSHAERRSFRDWMSPHDERAPAETSPSLIYIAVVLTFILIILEIDDHRAEVEALGLLTDNFPIPAVFLSP
ncbi:MAG TPA: hypothetical protein VK635_32780 [Bradyrhizobium sp.]|nr:hypothetical protein [Bradyrhizobium sp.]